MQPLKYTYLIHLLNGLEIKMFRGLILTFFF